MVWKLLFQFLLSYFWLDGDGGLDLALPPIATTPVTANTFNTSLIPTFFQAHSFNDLDQWESLYVKGVRNFKIDPYFFQQTRAPILFPWRWNQSYIVLSHDLPFLREERYFNLDDLFLELSPAGRTGSLLRRDAMDQKLQIQLCFKNAPSLCGQGKTAAAARLERDFLSIVDSFYDLAETLRLQFHAPGKLEFILDGAGKPYGCLENRWPNWKSVWISNDAPLSPPAVLNLEANVTSRFEILNNPADVKAWSQLAKRGFGRFAHNPHALQVWEPNDQQVIYEHIKVYSANPSPLHRAGLCFSSNSDPIMAALYTGALNATSNAPVLLNAHKNTIPLGLAVSGNSRLLTMVYQSEGGQVYYTKFDRDEQPNVFAIPQLLSIRAWERFVVSGENADLAVMSDGTGRFAQVAVSAENGNLQIVDQELRIAPLPPALAGGAEDSAKCVMVQSLRGGMFAALWSAASSPFCVLFAVLFDKTQYIHKSSCVARKANSTNNGLVTSADIFRLKRDTFAIVFADQKKHVYSTLWTAAAKQKPRPRPPNDEEADAEAEAAEEDQVFFLLKKIGVGTAPRFSILPALLEKNRIIALVLGDSNCANNEPFNKRASVLLCNAPQVSMRGTLTYTLGLAGDWEELLVRRGAGKRQTLSVCNPRLLHGAFDVGALPAPQLLMTNEKRGEARFVALHRTVDDFRIVDQPCAVPRWKNALVVNQFNFFFQDHLLAEGGLFTRGNLRLLLPPSPPTPPRKLLRAREVFHK